MNNKNPKPLISVIIPTRERANTLLFSIKTALDQVADAYEVIVSDNFSQDNTEEVVRGFIDSRLVYCNTGRRLSMCDNWEFALQRAKGKYIIFIGDDDAIMPGAIDKLQVMIQDKPSLVYCWPRPVYIWPISGRGASISCLPSNACPSEINLKKLARSVIKMGGARYPLLPSVYYGAVAKSVLDLMRKQTGRVFHSTQPDVFTAFAIPAFADTAINVGFAVAVVGHSPKSNCAVIYGNDKVNAEKFFQEFDNYKIHQTLPPGILPSLDMSISDTMLVAIDKFPQLYGDTRFNYSAMWAHMLRMAKYFLWDIDFKKIIQNKQEIRQYHNFSVIQFVCYCIAHKLAGLCRQMQKKTMKLDPFVEHVPDNISDFAKLLADYQKDGTKGQATKWIKKSGKIGSR
jgi:glycosyltransferase involved in cell wall biosynthesis